MSEPLEVSPSALYLAADQLEEHASDFSTAHQQAHQQAAQVMLGPGASAAALPGMLEAWESTGARLSKRHLDHASGHRNGANAYVQTDDGSADGIDNAGSEL